MFQLDGTLVTSPRDLRSAAACEFVTVRELDVLLGRAGVLEVPPDPMLERIVELGRVHEGRELMALRRQHPGRLHQVPAPAGRSRTAYREAADHTLELLADPLVDVVYQGVLFDDRAERDTWFLGYADFLVREPSGWVVVDTKLARSESVSALLQVGAYAEQLRAAGVQVAPVVRLVLGDGSARETPLDDLLPVYRSREQRLGELIGQHRGAPGAATWGDPRWSACGRCPVCEEQLVRTRDLALTARISARDRRELVAAGVPTIDALAGLDRPVDGIRPERLERLVAQASLQVAQAGPDDPMRYVVHTPEALSALPEPSPGDIFFDFEADPLWSEHGSTTIGLEYLFGVMEAPQGGDAEGAGRGAFVAFWAHDREQEKQALIGFMDYLAERRARWPGMHVYHYSGYERAALLRLAARHGVRQEQVDDLLRGNVLVDLYSVVRGGLRVSQRSYGLKKLEPLYMGADLRGSEGVTAGDDSIVAYHEYTSLLIAEAGDAAAERLEQIRAYNEDDCLSTLRLRDWLLERARERGVQPLPPVVPAEPEQEHDLERRLRDVLAQLEARHDDDTRDDSKRDTEPDTGHERTPVEQAVAMLAAGVQYHRREQKPFYWAHYDRLRLPVAEWIEQPDVLAVHEVEVDAEGWVLEEGKRMPRRRLVLIGEFAAGTRLRAGSSCLLVYEAPLPPGVKADPVRGVKSADVLSITELDDGRVVVEVSEGCGTGNEPYAQLPMALVPGQPPGARQLDEAIGELGELVLAEVEDAPVLPGMPVLTGGPARPEPVLPPQPGLDLLLRRPPRLRTGAALPAVGTGPGRHIEAITAALLDLDRSALAVQGPPGTGKTFVGARVVADLVARHGWTVGVVAQSHAVVEHFLDGLVDAGLDGRLVAKQRREPEPPGGTAWRELSSTSQIAAFLAERAEDADGLGTGAVVGGTAWDLTNTKRIARGQLDLLVVEEAGQFSTAATLACSVAAQRVLLLGDPQQLPQVSQGTHPEPVDRSALGWLLGDADVMPAELGYFLDTTYRMRPELTATVSRLSYAGQLASHEPTTTARLLEGVPAGVVLRDVDHHDNTVESVEEADEVVALVADLLGRAWTDAGLTRPLGEHDLLVVTPYNAQVLLIRSRLAAAGWHDVMVGTVDKMQGREAPVVIVSMAASAGHQISRGLAFLLNRNRLNVSISRGQHTAFLVKSRLLTDFPPRSVRELLALGAFIGVCESGRAQSEVRGVVGSAG